MGFNFNVSLAHFFQTRFRVCEITQNFQIDESDESEEEEEDQENMETGSQDNDAATRFVCYCSFFIFLWLFFVGLDENLSDAEMENPESNSTKIEHKLFLNFQNRN